MSIFGSIVTQYDERVVSLLRDAPLGTFEGVKFQEHRKMQAFFNPRCRIGSTTLINEIFKIWLKVNPTIKFDPNLFPDFISFVRNKLIRVYSYIGVVSPEVIQFESKRYKELEDGILNKDNLLEFVVFYSLTPPVPEIQVYNSRAWQMDMIANRVLKSL